MGQSQGWLWVAIVLLSLLFPSLSFATVVTLAWDPNGEPDLAGYKLYYGFASGNYVGFHRLGKGTTTTTIDLEDGVKYFFAVKAFDTREYESGFSNEVVYLPPSFADSFSDATRAGDSQWWTISGNWRGARKTFASVSLKKTNRALVSALPEFSAGRISTRLKPTSRSLRYNTGIVFSFSDDQHYRYVFIRGSRIYLGQVGDTFGEMAGIKAVARKKLESRWYRLRLDVRPDGLVSVFLGDATQPVLTYRFADTPSGSIGLQAQKSVAYFDDFRVWDAEVLP